MLPEAIVDLIGRLERLPRIRRSKFENKVLNFIAFNTFLVELLENLAECLCRFEMSVSNRCPTEPFFGSFAALIASLHSFICPM